MDISGNAHDVDIVLTYTPDDVSITSTPFGAVITLNGAPGIGVPGSPSIPRAVVRVAMPPGAIASGVTASVQSQRFLSHEPVLVAPVQSPRPGPNASGPSASELPKQSMRRMNFDTRNLATTVPRVALPDPELYARALAEPRKTARLLDAGDGHLPVAVVEINPLALDGGGRLVLNERIHVSIAYRIVPDGDLVQARADRSTSRFISSAQLRDQTMLMRTLVVNPQQVVLPPDWPGLRSFESEYLVITDRQMWDPVAIAPTGPVDGDPVAEFQRLTAWKHQRGLSTRLVTVTDIVAGHYGDFRTGARDLPEVIRNFVKHARSAWGVRWLLLGGDTQIIPARVVDGGFTGEITPGTTNPPAPGQAFWTGGHLNVNTKDLFDWWGADPTNTLVRPDTGAVIPYHEPSRYVRPTLGPHWYFATDETYAVHSDVPTDYVVVAGTQAQVDAGFRFLYHWNQIPTDFYYASLVGPGYGIAGKHDWDVRSNGVYGEHAYADADDPDQITWQAHVSVGRAPIRSGGEAATFVDKVLAYEQLPEAGPLTFGHIYERDMVVVGDNWGGRVGVWSAGMSTPDDNQYVHTGGSQYTVMQISAAEIPITYTLYSQISDTDVRLLPYDATVTAGGRGWHYVRGIADLTPSVFTFNFYGNHFRIPVPSGFIAVYSTDETELAPVNFILDQPDPDGSMLDQEQVVGIVRASLHGITSIERIYTDEVDLPAGSEPAEYLSTTSLTAALQRGPHLVSLSGHGNPEGCCCLGPGVAASLTNGLPGFIGYADSCLTGDFAEDGWDVMNRELLINPNGGAVGYVGSTRFSWIGIGDDFQRLFWQRLATTHNLGLLADSRCELVHSSGLNAWNTKWVVMSLNLHGDPEMPIWTRAPQRLRLPRTKPVIQPWEWPIRDEYRRPVPEAVLTIVLGDQVIQARADRHGVARIDASLLSAGEDQDQLVRAHVTITAPGYRPDMGEIILDLTKVSIPEPRVEVEMTEVFVVERPVEKVDESNLTRDFRFTAE